MAEAASITVNVKSTSGDKYTVKTTSDATIEAVKVLVNEVSNIDASLQRLIYKGHVLKDDKTVDEYGIKDGHTVILVKGSAKKKPAPAATSSASATSGTAPAAPAASSGPAQGAAPQAAAANPFAAFMGGGMGGMGGGANPLAGMNPAMIGQMMQNPMVQQMMTNLSQNPQLLQQMFQSNPMLQQMAAQNPMLQNMVQNPQMMATLMNPQTMQAISQLQGMMGAQGAAASGTGAAASAPATVPDVSQLLSGMFPQAATGAAATSSTDASASTSDSTSTSADSSSADAASSDAAPPANPLAAMMQQMMGGAGANAAGTGDANANPMAALQGLFAQQGANGAANPLAGLFSGAGGQGANAAANPFAMFGQAPAAAQANVQPEILYRDQLRQLNDMGFTDAQPNIQALIATGGNVQAAIDRLLSGG